MNRREKTLRAAEKSSLCPLRLPSAHSAPSVGVVLKIFGLDKLSARDQSIRNRAMANYLTITKEKLLETAQDYEANPDIISNLLKVHEQRQTDNEAESKALENNVNLEYLHLPILG